MGKIGKRIKLVFRIGLLVCLSFFLSSCLEVKQEIDINKDGSGNARFEIVVQQEWAAMVIPELEKGVSGGWKIVEKKERDGKHFIVLSRKFKDISELSDDIFNYSFSSERKSFLKKYYTLEIKQIKSSDISFPYEIIIKVPGEIIETNGLKIAPNKAKWSLYGLNQGRKIVVKSSAFMLPSALIYTIIALAGAVLIFLISRVFKKTKISVSKTSIATKTIFCIHCGKENSISATYCTNCGERLSK